MGETAAGLPPVPTPQGAYQPFVRCGDLVFTAGMTPRLDGALVLSGRLGYEGGDPDVAAVRAAAQVAARNALAAAAAGAGGLGNLTAVVRVTVFVAGSPSEGELTRVAEGVREALSTELGEPGGAAAASVIGVAVLPSGAPVEVEMVAAVIE